MHDVLAGYIEKEEVPGIAALISRRNEVHIHILGKKAFNGSPLTRDTIFRISSMTKPVTALATMILVEECRLRLDDPVDQLLPELSNRSVLKRIDAPLDDTTPARRSIKVRDLLTFCMGIGIVMAPPGTYPIQKAMEELGLGQGLPKPSLPPEPDEWIRRLGTLPLMHQPGEKWMYNTGSDVLGILIARASGQPLEAFFRERIFEPLGMKDTSFSVPQAKLRRFTTSYWTDPDKKELQIYDDAIDGQWTCPPAFPSAAAGLVSTVDDYLAFGQMMLNKGKYGRRRLLSRPAFDIMVADQLTAEQKSVSGLFPNQFEDRGWGFGLAVVTKRSNIYESIGKFGWDGGLGTSWYSDPREEMVTILMTQKAWSTPRPENIFRDFWTLAYQAIDD
ncbi:MAG: serine hydrolase [Smithellaceae bacterium]|nr:serine hydrolase [Smithellaceae bacterium]